MTEHAAPVALITGAARRIGATLARQLHAAGYNILVHHRGHAEAALILTNELNRIRPTSATAIAADLNRQDELRHLADRAQQTWNRIDVLINNASSFYPTPIESTTQEQWDDLINSNLKAPFFLIQSLIPALRRQQGCIINIVDIHADRPLPQHAVYCAAKAGNAMLIKALARDLAPDIRVNGIAPGAILWPEQHDTPDTGKQQALVNRIPLQKIGSPEDIANAALFLIQQAPYITGQIIAVDGGRSLVT